MKKLSEIKVNAAQLRLIIGENINYTFPTKKTPVFKNGKESFKITKLPEFLSNIAATSDYAIKRSHDPRFDKKHPVNIAIDHIRASGLNKYIIAAIRNDFQCQKQKAIVGKWKVLNDVITEQHKAHVVDLLTSTHEAKKHLLNGEYYNAKCR